MRKATRAAWIALLACCLFGLADRVFAADIVMVNESGYDVNFVIKYWDKRTTPSFRNDYYVSGWYTIKSGSSGSISRITDPKRTIYYYAEDVNEQVYWNGNASHRQSILTEKFDKKHNVVKDFKGSYQVQMGAATPDANGNVRITIR